MCTHGAAFFIPGLLRPHKALSDVQEQLATAPSLGKIGSDEGKTDTIKAAMQDARAALRNYIHEKNIEARDLPVDFHDLLPIKVNGRKGGRGRGRPPLHAYQPLPAQIQQKKTRCGLIFTISGRIWRVRE